MKKTLTILIALMALCFTQCKPTPEGGDENSRKVKVSCSIPINKGDRSDFTNIMENGKINWSDGEEYVYLAIPHSTQAQIIELRGYAYGESSSLEFEGEVPESLLEEDGEYEVWYFGNSINTSYPYVNKNMSGDKIQKINGSISKQSGNIEDLGYHHIAKVKVKAVMEGDEIVLPLKGVMENCMAIAYLDLEGVANLNGDAIVGTEYSLQYNGSLGEYEFAVTESSTANINVTTGASKSYLVLLPNEEINTELRTVKADGSIYGVKFGSKIKANKLYYKTDGAYGKETLPWNKISDGVEGDYDYVDLGLSVKWATCNVGANAPEEYGNYYAWGEVNTKDTYTEANSLTYGMQMNDITGNAQYDAATANWGGDWRMPTKDELNELRTQCTWTWTTQNGVKGYKVTSKVNSNYIFLPAAGYRRGSSLYNVGSLGYYLSSTPNDSNSNNAYYLYFDNTGYHGMGSNNRSHGRSVRPVCGGGSSTPSDETITVNGVTFTMIAVEGGTFQMGATSEQGSDAYDDESPVHSVTLSDYHIGETEVTQELWQAVMGSNPSNFNGYPQRPVECVSWNDCQTFISKLNELTGKNFRLPTEAEWEYAARGGNKSQGYKYSGSNTIEDVAWYYNSSSGTQNVKTKQANELGIYDMSGNVWEWCQDWYGSYSSGSQTNPTGPSSGSYRVYRGGSWGSSAGNCRVSLRHDYYPGSWISYGGLRLVL